MKRAIGCVGFLVLFLGCDSSESDGESSDAGLATDGGADDTGLATDAAPVDPNDLAAGEMLFLMPHADGNTFACNSCHALTEPAADFMRPGHPIGDAANRPTYKNGQLNSLLDAVNTCRREWMVALPFSDDDNRWQALSGYLQSVAGDAPAEPLTFKIVAPPEALDGGDADAGRAFFNGACAVCHGPNAAGTMQAPPLVGEFLDAELIAQRVRTSGTRDSAVYDGLSGGRMPFWSEDRISDDSLRDVIAFVLANEPGDGPMVELPEDLERDCEATHPNVGVTGEFSAFAHDVGGTVTVVDDCTIRVDGFTFDGQGVNVQIYGGQDGNYRDGFSMSVDIRRSEPYSGETLFFQLPEGQTLDDLNGVSVWCVPVGINFGDAPIVP